MLRFSWWDASSMAKRRQMIRRPPPAGKRAAAPKRATARVDLKKVNASLRRELGHPGVDRDDPGVSMGRAQHIEPQRALVGLVVDELPLPGEQPLVFQTLDRLARTETHIAGKNVHQFVLRASCRIKRGFSGFFAGDNSFN